jgi:single-stranded-DNA-specific exonuclease
MSKLQEAMFTFLQNYKQSAKDDFVYELSPKKLEHFADTILDAIRNDKKILLWGDYDVDGIGSTAMLTEIIDSFSFAMANKPTTIEYTIPSRSDGYGINIDSFRHQATLFDLIITLDNGSHKEFYNELSDEEKKAILVFDHHPNGDYEKDLSVLNPNPNGDVKISTGILVQDFHEYLLENFEKYAKENKKEDTIDLCAMTLISDMASLNNEMVRQRIADGVEQANKRQRAILQQIFPEYRGRISMKNMAFELIPVINSIGRLHEEPSLGVEVLIHKKQSRKSRALVDQALQTNELRKEMTDFYTKAAYNQIEIRGLENDALIFVHSDTAPIGINGLIASNVFNRYGRDALATSRDFRNGGAIVGSGRGNNIKKTLLKMGETLNGAQKDHGNLQRSEDVFRFGGHNQAIGIKLYDPNTFEALRKWSCTNIPSVYNLKPRRDIEVFDKIITIKEYNMLCETYSNYINGDIKFNDAFYARISGMVYAISEHRNDFVVLSIADEDGGDLKILTKRQKDMDFLDLDMKTFKIEVQPFSKNELSSTIGTSIRVLNEKELFSKPDQEQRSLRPAKST